MKVFELVPFLGDEVILYKKDGEDYVDIFQGISSEIPSDISSMEVGIIGSKKKGILDIEVR